MIEASKTLQPGMSAGSRSVTGSPGSEAGLLHYSSPDGQATGQSGQDHVPASPTPQQASRKDMPMTGTSGRTGTGSSAPASLQSCLESRLRTRLRTAGSTLFQLTWKSKTTSLGRRYCLLRASAPRTGDTVSIGPLIAMLQGWPTAAGHEFEIADVERMLARREELKKKGYNGNGFGMTLSMTAVALCGWPTAQVSDVTGGGQAKRADGRANLNDFAMLTAWTTPQAHDETGRSKHQKEIHGTAHGCACLVNEALLTGWGTPKVATGDYQYSSGNHDRPALNLSGEARLAAFGETAIGFLLGRNGWEIVPALGQLRPEHSRWLMGFPAAWDDCGVMAMQYVRRSRRRSSKPTVKREE